VLTTYYHPVLGGVETHARQLVTHLHQTGIDVRVATKRVGKDEPRDTLVDGVPVHHVGPPGERTARGKWLILPALFAKILTLRATFDVIVCIDYRGIGLAAVTAGKMLGRAVIAQGETAGVLARTGNGSRSGLGPESRLVRLLKAPVRAVYRRASHIVCIGRDLEREALDVGVPRERVHYLPHGVDLKRFRPAFPGEREQIRRDLGWPADCPVVLFVGRLSVEKGVMDLLAAWRLVRHPRAILAIVGPDMPGHPWDAGPRARALVAAHALESRVRLEGPVSDPSPFFRAADLFVQPSHFEALGNTALEAMASSVPVVASGVGGLADFCVDGENALLHEPRSPASLARAVETMLEDASLRARLAQAARRTVSEGFELGSLLGRYVALIEAAARSR
jgi:glycosyltransferase involved in cell wall biosynthesis